MVSPAARRTWRRSCGPCPGRPTARPSQPPRPTSRQTSRQNLENLKVSSVFIIVSTGLGLLIIRMGTLKHYAIKSNLNSCFFQTSSQSSWLTPREISTLCSRKPTGFYTKETRTSSRTSSKTLRITTRMETLIWKWPCKNSSASCIRGCLVFSILNTALIASK